MAQVMMMTLMIGPEGKILQQHQGIKAAVRENFDRGTEPMVAATYLASALMADAIEQSDDMVRKQIIEQLLTEWSRLEPNDQREFSRQLAAGTLNQDMLLTRCQWLLIRGQDLLVDGRITEHDFRILKDSIYGPLAGISRADRTAARIDDAIVKILVS